MIGSFSALIDHHWREGEQDSHEETFKHSLESGYQIQWKEDWLLPQINISFTEPDMYEQILAQSWTNYMFIMAQQDKIIGPVKDVSQKIEDSGTVHMSQILPNDLFFTEKLLEDVNQDNRIEEPRACACEHCGTDKTSLWRRRNGRTVCNACALYEKLHGIPRPAHLLNQVVRRRNRTDPSRRKRR